MTGPMHRVGSRLAPACQNAKKYPAADVTKRPGLKASDAWRSWFSLPRCRCTLAHWRETHHRRKHSRGFVRRPFAAHPRSPVRYSGEAATHHAAAAREPTWAAGARARQQKGRLAPGQGVAGVTAS